MSHEVLVIGAGPAGSLVARRLAASGARVALVGAAARAGWEGLSRRSVALLAEEGIELPAGLMEGPLVRSGEWGDRRVSGVEWLVERRALAAALREHACAAGAHDVGDIVTDLEWKNRRWHGVLRDGGAISASQVIEARGRRGPERRGPLLLAVGRQFHRRPDGGFGVPLEPGTRLHAIDIGWCWWAARADGLWVQVVGHPRGGSPAGWIARAAAQIPELERALERADAVGGLVARPAHARLGLSARDAAGAWRVGDAAVAHDPLSGQGVYEALRGARLVATAVQSVRCGGEVAPAQRFVAERQEESWLRGVRIAAGFYRENAVRGPFWSQTAAAYEGVLPRAAALPNAAAALRIERRPVLCGDRILEREVIVTPQHPRGVWHVADVPLVSLKSYLESVEHASVKSAAAAVERPIAAVASAIHWLQQTGIVARQARPGVPLGG